jgi:hypothetical protein
MKIENIKALGYAKGQQLAYELAAEYYSDIGDIEANWQTFKDAVLEGMDLASRRTRQLPGRLR